MAYVLTITDDGLAALVNPKERDDSCGFLKQSVRHRKVHADRAGNCTASVIQTLDTIQGGAVGTTSSM